MFYNPKAYFCTGICYRWQFLFFTHIVDSSENNIFSCPNHSLVNFPHYKCFGYLTHVNSDIFHRMSKENTCSHNPLQTILIKIIYIFYKDNANNFLRRYFLHSLVIFELFVIMLYCVFLANAATDIFKNFPWKMNMMLFISFYWYLWFITFKYFPLGTIRVVSNLHTT